MLKINSIFVDDNIELTKNLIFERSTIELALLEPIKALVKRDLEEGTSVFCDAELAVQVRMKADMIFKLVDGLQSLLLMKHQVPELENYIEMCSAIDNYDFSKEI